MWELDAENACCPKCAACRGTASTAGRASCRWCVHAGFMTASCCRGLQPPEEEQQEEEQQEEEEEEEEEEEQP